jgi:vanillate/4-hydroxybenzoate decarboxylase subunit C
VGDKFAPERRSNFMRAYRDLREFLSVLDQEHQLLKITEQVNLEPDLAALALGMDKDTSPRDQFFEFVRRYHLYPGELDRVDTAPWQEVVVDKC